MSIPQAALIFFAAMLAGALNSVAGGGSFLSFPALLFIGVSAKPANATNTLALWPGTVASVGAYRAEIARPLANRVPLVVTSLIGGAVGAYLLLATPESTFGALLPWLLLFALLLFIFGKRASVAIRRTVSRTSISGPGLLIGVLAAQLFVAIYGGFFGGGIGIMVLAVLSLTGMDDIHHMNGVKTLLAMCINGVAVFAFILAKAIAWGPALIMIIGAIIGGYFGAFYARKIDPARVRAFVIVVGSLMTLYFFYRTYFAG